MIFFEHLFFNGIYNRVRYFRNMIFALAAFLWLPASAHCMLETIPGLEFLQCSVQTGAHQNQPDGCGQCCSLEKSQYRAELAATVIPLPQIFFAVIETATVPLAALPAQVSVGILTAAPPETLNPRHFLSRAALPIRAPSLAS